MKEEEQAKKERGRRTGEFSCPSKKNMTTQMAMTFAWKVDRCLRSRMTEREKTKPNLQS